MVGGYVWMMHASSYRPGPALPASNVSLCARGAHGTWEDPTDCIATAPQLARDLPPSSAVPEVDEELAQCGIQSHLGEGLSGDELVHDLGRRTRLDLSESVPWPLTSCITGGPCDSSRDSDGGRHHQGCLLSARVPWRQSLTASPGSSTGSPAVAHRHLKLFMVTKVLAQGLLLETGAMLPEEGRNLERAGTHQPRLHQPPQACSRRPRECMAARWCGTLPTASFDTVIAGS